MNRAGASRGAAETVDEYLARVTPGSRRVLASVRRAIKDAAPDAVESISYGIPTYKVDGERLIYFSAATRHCAIHMVREEHLREAERRGFGVGRGSIRFTPEHPLPGPLLARILKARLAQIRGSTRGRVRPARD